MTANPAPPGLPNPMSKTIRVSGMSRSGCEDKITGRLNGIDGVLKVKASAKSGKVKVSYDLRFVRLAALEAALAELGYPLARGFLADTLRDWGRFTEQNRIDAMKVDPHCCNKDPTGSA